MTKPTYVSYSAASRFKSCPTKFYLSKQYQDKRISSSLPFGKAVESGVTALLEGKELPEALTIFDQNWETEHLKGNEYRPILDNLDLQFYASDLDHALFDDEDQKLLDSWAEEMLGESDRPWLDVFEDVAGLIKSDSKMSDAQLAFYNRVIWRCCSIRGHTMLKAFHDKILPGIDLTRKEYFASQREVSIQNEEGDKIVGYVDYVVFHKEHGWVILDLKTASYPYSHHKLVTSEQLKVYVAALSSEIGSKKAGYVVLLKKIVKSKSCDKCGSPKQGMSKKCKVEGCSGEYSKVTLDGDVQLMVQDYSDESLDDILDDYMNVAVAIKNEVKYKNPESCFSFGRQCEYYSVCWQGKDPSTLPNLESKKVETKTEGESK